MRGLMNLCPAGPLSGIPEGESVSETTPPPHVLLKWHSPEARALRLQGIATGVQG